MKQLRDFWWTCFKSGCDKDDFKFVRCSRCGCEAQLTYECKHLKSILKVINKPDDKDVNKVIILGSVSVGVSLRQLEELFAAMNICIMAQKEYRKSRNELHRKMKELAKKVMADGALGEFNIAQGQRKGKNGIVYIAIITDESWMTRSLKKSIIPSPLLR